MSKTSTTITEWIKLKDGKWSDINNWADRTVKDNDELISAQNNSSIKCVVGLDVENFNDQVSLSSKSSSEISLIDKETSPSNCSLHPVNGEDVNLSVIIDRLSFVEEKYMQTERKLNILRSRLRDAEKDIDDQYDYTTFLEKQLCRLEQYGRRENIEIVGIPANITDQQLESETIKVLRAIGLQHITPFHIVGCHRVGTEDRYGRKNTIVRFLNRKDAIQCLRLKRNLYRCKPLGYDNLLIVENLCPAYKSIFETVSQLKNEGKIKKVWTYNGIVNYKLSDDDREKSVKVYHYHDLDKFYVG